MQNPAASPTRAIGNFFVNHDGQLVLGMGDGYKLEPGIFVPKGVTDVSISQDGVVEVVRAGTNAKQRIGQIELSQFVNPQGLSPLAGSLYLQTSLSGSPSPSKPGENDAGQVLQGFLESSNVDPNRGAFECVSSRTGVPQSSKSSMR